VFVLNHSFLVSFTQETKRSGSGQV
jgi:hypothetical protein